MYHTHRDRERVLLNKQKKIELEEKANSAPHSVEAKKKRRKNDVRDNVIEQLYMKSERMH